MDGKNILEIEVTNISKFGFWLIIEDKEMFLPFELFPWFKKESVENITNVELLNESHIYWPSLDIDLDLGSITDFEKYPLVYH